MRAKPASLHEASGAYANNPSRRKVNPDGAGPLGNPPDDFSDEHREVWRGIVARAPIGILTASDYDSLIVFCKLWVQVMSNFEKAPIGHINQIRVMLGQYGMNPSDRAKFDMPKAPDANPFDKIGK